MKSSIRKIRRPRPQYKATPWRSRCGRCRRVVYFATGDLARERLALHWILDHRDDR